MRADGTVLEPGASSWWKRRFKAGDEIRIPERFSSFSPHFLPASPRNSITPTSDTKRETRTGKKYKYIARKQENNLKCVCFNNSLIHSALFRHVYRCRMNRIHLKSHPSFLLSAEFWFYPSESAGWKWPGFNLGGDADVLGVCRHVASSCFFFQMLLKWQQQAGGGNLLTRLCSSSQVEEEKRGNSLCCACVLTGGPRFPQGGRRRPAGCSNHGAMVHGSGREEDAGASQWRCGDLVPAPRWALQRLLRPECEWCLLWTADSRQARVHSQPCWICGGWVEGWWSTALPC